MRNNSYTILGSSSGVPLADRNSSGYVLNINGRLNLIDCGGGTTSSFLRRGFNPLYIENIFITHTHPDHVCELPLIIQLMYVSGFDKKLSVYVPEEFVEPLKIYLRSVYLLVEKFSFEFEIIGYCDGFQYENDFTLEAIGNTHLSHYKEWIEKYSMPNRMLSHSFKMKIKDTSIFHSGDLGSFEDIENHLDGNKYVITELTHINLEKFFEFIPSINVGEFIITHLGSPVDVKKLQSEIIKAGIENITIAMDGLELPL